MNFVERYAGTPAARPISYADCKFFDKSSRDIDHYLFSRTYVLFHNCIRHDQLLMIGCAPLKQFTACKANDMKLAIRCGEQLFRLAG